MSEIKKYQHEKGVYRNVYRNPSRLAKAVWGAIRSNGYMAELEYIICNRSYDIFVPTLNLLIEVDGEYWHYSERAIKQGVPERDARKEEIARASPARLPGMQHAYRGATGTPVNRVMVQTSNCQYRTYLASAAGISP